MRLIGFLSGRDRSSCTHRRTAGAQNLPCDILIQRQSVLLYYSKCDDRGSAGGHGSYRRCSHGLCFGASMHAQERRGLESSWQARQASGICTPCTPCSIYRLTRRILQLSPSSSRVVMPGPRTPCLVNRVLYPFFETPLFPSHSPPSTLPLGCTGKLLAFDTHLTVLTLYRAHDGLLIELSPSSTCPSQG